MKKPLKSLAKVQDKAARRRLLDELFQDLYHDRLTVYRMNFVRGVAFGLGSVLGGTILVALLIWLLSFLSQFIPFLSDFFNTISGLIERSAE